jgi:hypothetical protein
VLKELKVPKVLFRVLQVQREHKVPQVIRGLKGRQEIQDQQVLKVLKVIREHKVRQVIREHKVIQALKVTQVPKAR